jgi:hypothetical protein
MPAQHEDSRRFESARATLLAGTPALTQWRGSIAAAAGSAAAVLLTALLLPLPARADDVYLRNGSVFEGVIAHRSETHVLVDLGIGQIRFPLEQVARVVEAITPLEQFRDRRDALLVAPDSAPEQWLELASFARLRGLDRDFRETTLLLARIAPDHPGLAPLMSELGYERDPDAGWLTVEQAMARRGLVRYQGEWITPELRTARIADELRVLRERELAHRAAFAQASTGGPSNGGPSNNEVALASIELAREVVATTREPRTLAAPATFTVGAGSYFVPALPLSGSFGFVLPVGGRAGQDYLELVRSDLRALANRQPGSFISLDSLKHQLGEE